MTYSKKVFIGIVLEFIIILSISLIWNTKSQPVSINTNNKTTQTTESSGEELNDSNKEDDFIKWVDFNVTYDALNLAYKYDVESRDEDIRLNWIEILAYVASKNGGNFTSASKKEINNLVEKVKEDGISIKSLGKERDYYDYYYQAYSAALGGLVGDYQIEEPQEGDGDEKVWVKKYGLKGFSPIAKGFPFSEYDDFGVSRNYGFKRRHLGHDMMGQVGTPIVAVESGYVEALGWNQYGGWRIGIRSFDKKRYYYYAHLRQNFPFNKSLEEGSLVQAGDVIGYMGHTGYSTQENVNNIKTGQKQ